MICCISNSSWRFYIKAISSRFLMQPDFPRAPAHRPLRAPSGVVCYVLAKKKVLPHSLSIGAPIYTYRSERQEQEFAPVQGTFVPGYERGATRPYRAIFPCNNLISPPTSSVHNGEPIKFLLRVYFFRELPYPAIFFSIYILSSSRAIIT